MLWNPARIQKSLGNIYYVEESAHNRLWITSPSPWPHHRAWSRYGRTDQNGNPILFAVLCRRWWSPKEIIESCNARVNIFDIIHVKYDVTTEALTSKDHLSLSGSPCTQTDVKYFQNENIVPVYLPTISPIQEPDNVYPVCVTDEFTCSFGTLQRWRSNPGRAIVSAGTMLFFLISLFEVDLHLEGLMFWGRPAQNISQIKIRYKFHT